MSEGEAPLFIDGSIRRGSWFSGGQSDKACTDVKQSSSDSTADHTVNHNTTLGQLCERTFL